VWIVLLILLDIYLGNFLVVLLVGFGYASFSLHTNTLCISLVYRDGKMGPARWAGPPARLKKYGPGHEFQPASPWQPGPSSPLARRASPRAKTGQPATRKTKTGGGHCTHSWKLRTHRPTIRFSSFLNFFLFLCHPFCFSPCKHQTHFYYYKK